MAEDKTYEVLERKQLLRVNDSPRNRQIMPILLDDGKFSAYAGSLPFFCDDVLAGKRLSSASDMQCASEEQRMVHRLQKGSSVGLADLLASTPDYTSVIELPLPQQRFNPWGLLGKREEIPRARYLQIGYDFSRFNFTDAASGLSIADFMWDLIASHGHFKSQELVNGVADALALTARLFLDKDGGVREEAGIDEIKGLERWMPSPVGGVVRLDVNSYRTFVMESTSKMGFYLDPFNSLSDFNHVYGSKLRTWDIARSVMGQE